MPSLQLFMWRDGVCPFPPSSLDPCRVYQAAKNEIARAIVGNGTVVRYMRDGSTQMLFATGISIRPVVFIQSPLRGRENHHDSSSIMEAEAFSGGGLNATQLTTAFRVELRSSHHSSSCVGTVGSVQNLEYVRQICVCRLYAGSLLLFLCRLNDRALTLTRVS